MPFLVMAWALSLGCCQIFWWELWPWGRRLGWLLAVAALPLWYRVGSRMRQHRVWLCLAVAAVLLAWWSVPATNLGARSYLWRRESTLLEQVEAIRMGTPVHTVSGYRVRVELEPFRVYWPHRDRGINSWGLVYDPSHSVESSIGGYVFGEQLVGVERLRGCWYVCGFT